jgi:large subunit ribosomal protein L25
VTEVRSLSLQVRNAVGTGPTRALRRTGFVPVSVYGKKQSPKNMSVEERLLVKEMKEKGFLSHLFEISVEGVSKKALIKSIQKHPVSDRPLHLDLITIDADSRIRVDVTIKTLNEDKSPGIKQGGILNLLRHSLSVTCSPASIPEFIEVDVGGLKLGSSVHLSDLKLPATVQVEHAEKIDAILTVAQPKVSSASEESGESAESATEAKSE